jgi:uncharacterized membrane protein
MAFCGKCGEKVADGVKFCPSCGASMTGSPAKPAWRATEVKEIQANPADAEANKGMAIIAYILFFVPLLTGDHKKSPFVMYHTNQGMVLFLFSVGGSIISSILMILIIGVFLMFVVGIISLVFCVIGIINVLNGKMKPLPLIGQFEIIK